VHRKVIPFLKNKLPAADAILNREKYEENLRHEGELRAVGDTMSAIKYAHDVESVRDVLRIQEANIRRSMKP
jgi:hypothetical protein